MKSLISQQIISPVSVLIAQLIQLISWPTTVNCKSNTRKKGSENYKKVVKIEKKTILAIAKAIFFYFPFKNISDFYKIRICTFRTIYLKTIILKLL